MSDIAGTSTGSAATTAALELAAAKRHLNVSSTADDTYIGELVDSATRWLQDRCNRVFVWQTRTLKMDDFADKRYVHNRVIYPRRSPLKSVTSIKYVDTAGTTTTLASTDYVAGTGDCPGRISEAMNATWPAVQGDADNVTITYVAGHTSAAASVPAHVKHALRMVVGHWYRNREAVLTGTISKEIEFGLDAILESEQVELYG